MPRKRLTQMVPFLLPLRRAQKIACYYGGMRLDANRYAHTRLSPFAHELVRADSVLINERTGADIAYQYNKVHNLKLAAQTVSGVVIRPGETFSVWWLLRQVDKRRYRDGLCVRDGRLVGVKGGGMCQLSNLLFWLFLHTPLTIVERHAHHVKEFPNPSDRDPCGVDATILEGWLDLRARNDTDTAMQVEITFDRERIHGRILTEHPLPARYAVANRALTYTRENGKTWETVEVWRQALDRETGAPLGETLLYVNRCEIGYDLPEPIRPPQGAQSPA